MEDIHLQRNDKRDMFTFRLWGSYVPWGNAPPRKCTGLVILELLALQYLEWHTITDTSWLIQTLTGKSSLYKQQQKAFNLVFGRTVFFRLSQSRFLQRGKLISKSANINRWSKRKHGGDLESNNHIDTSWLIHRISN